MKRKLILFFITFILLIVYALIKIFITGMSNEGRMKVFLPQIQSYLETEITKDYSGEPYVRGKIVTIDTGTKTVDSQTYLGLSDVLKAEKPQEVGTVLLIEWFREKEGYYTDEKTGQVIGDAYRGFAKVSIVDWLDKVLVEERIFEGEALPEKVYVAGTDDYKNAYPVFTVLKYLENLPKR
ncbi:MAG: hypothetical protein AB1498_10030 [bacterium]